MVEISNKVLGKFLSIPILLIFGTYLIASLAAILRVFGEVIKMTLLIRTPLEVILISMLLLVLVLARGGIETIARFDEAIFIIMFSTSIIGIFLALPQADFTNILPIGRTDFRDFLKGTYETTYSFAGFEIVLLIIPFIKSTGKMFRAGITAFTVVITTYVAAVVLSFGYFGLAEIKALTWPTLSLIRSIEVPGSFIERLEGVVMAQWMLFAYTSLIAYVFALATLSSRAVKNKEFKHFCAIFIPVIYLLAMIPNNVPQVYEILDKSTLYLGTPAVFIFPILLLVISRVRKMGVKENA